MDWKQLSSKYLTKFPYFTSREDRCEMPDGKIVDPYYVVELATTVCAMAITAENQVILTRQYRHPINETILELPGGFVDKAEDEKTALTRELLEETGYEFSSIEYLGRVAANPGVLSNYTALFLATGGKKISQQKLDRTEDIEIILKSVEEVKQMLLQNEMKQALHVCCLYYAFQKLEVKG